MKVSFTKMHGCGNDYIYFNGFEYEIVEPEVLAVSLSNRHFGIGGDGIVLILPSIVADAKMRMFNIDGSEGKMCGNAIRCVAKYLYDNSIILKEEMTIETLSGIKTLLLIIEDGKVLRVKVDMGKAEFLAKKIPVSFNKERVIDESIRILDKDYKITCVSMGNPHAVVFMDEIDSLELEKIGPVFENHSAFLERINTEFIEIIERNHIRMRVWERGSGETMACGTGACGAVAAAVINGYCDEDTEILVELRGGEITICYTKEAVFMTGGCKTVFDGVVDIGGNYVN